MPETPEIIIIKRDTGHGQPHGGAWKVAYADFVTAMMALFIVLWLMNASNSVKDAVSGYFRDPSGNAQSEGTRKIGVGDIATLKVQQMEQLKEQLQREVHRSDPLDKLKNHIEITITQEGLRIELMDSAKGTFFEMGKARPTVALKEILQVLSPELGRLSNRISVEGHTDARPYESHGAYDNWDLSTDRANEARRLMLDEGLRSNQISQVRGFADQHLRLPQHPADPSNRRISIIVQYQEIIGHEMLSPEAKNLQSKMQKQ